MKNYRFRNLLRGPFGSATDTLVFVTVGSAVLLAVALSISLSSDAETASDSNAYLEVATKDVVSAVETDWGLVGDWDLAEES